MAENQSKIDTKLKFDEEFNETDAWRKQVKADLNALVMPGTKEIRQTLERMAKGEDISGGAFTGRGVSSGVFRMHQEVQDKNVEQYGRLYNLYKFRLEKGDPNAPKDFLDAVEDSVANGRFSRHQDLPRFLESQTNAVMQQHSEILHAQTLVKQINFSTTQIHEAVQRANQSGDFSAVVSMINDSKGKINWLQANKGNKFIGAMIGEKGPLHDMETKFDDVLLELNRKKLAGQPGISVDEFRVAMSVTGGLEHRNIEQFKNTVAKNIERTGKPWVDSNNSFRTIAEDITELKDMERAIQNHAINSNPDNLSNIAGSGPQYDNLLADYKSKQNQMLIKYGDRLNELKPHFENNLLNIYKYTYSPSESELDSHNKKSLGESINSMMQTRNYGGNMSIIEQAYGIDFDEDLKAFSLGLVVDKGTVGNVDAYHRRYFHDVFMQDRPEYIGTYEEYISDDALKLFRPSDDAFAGYIPSLDAGGEGGGDAGGEGGEGIEGGEEITEESESPGVLKWVAPVGLLAYATAPEKIGAATIATKDALLNAGKNVFQGFGMDVDQMTTFWDSNEAADIFKKVDEWDERLKKVSKGSTQWHKIREKRNAFIKRTAKGWATKSPTFKDWKWSPAKWEQLIKGKDKYNFFKFKRSLKNTLTPELFNKIFGKAGGVAKTVTTSVGSRIIPFSLGQTIAEQAGAGKYGQALSGAATAAAVPSNLKKVAPKLGKMLGTEAGKKALKRFLMKQVSKKVATSIIAGGGVASVITGIIGTGWATLDIYKFIRDYNE